LTETLLNRDALQKSHDIESVVKFRMTLAPLTK